MKSKRPSTWLGQVQRRGQWTDTGRLCWHAVRHVTCRRRRSSGAHQPKQSPRLRHLRPTQHRGHFGVVLAETAGRLAGQTIAAGTVDKPVHRQRPQRGVAVRAVDAHVTGHGHRRVRHVHRPRTNWPRHLRQIAAPQSTTCKICHAHRHIVASTDNLSSNNQETEHIQTQTNVNKKVSLINNTHKPTQNNLC